MKKALGATIRELRKQRGLTQKELAKRAKLTEAGLSLLERGETLPSLTTLQAISVELDVPLITLIRSTEPPEDPERGVIYGRILAMAVIMSKEDLEKAAGVIEVLARNSTAEDG